MAHRIVKTPADRQAASAFAAYADLDLATRLIEAYPTLPPNLKNAYNQEHIKPRTNQLGWMPNACWWCSGEVIGGKHHPFQKVRGTGKDVFDVEKDCPYCGAYPKQIRGFGPQANALIRTEKEILFGGSLGGGKTRAMTMFMIMGNPHEPKFDSAGRSIWHNQYYVMHPAYRGLVIRKNEKDLRAWLDEVIPIYKGLGGELNRSPLEFRFKWGSRIYCGHLDDTSAWEKYQGMPELHRLGFEELTQLSNSRLYFQMLARVRTKHPELRPQVFASANPVGPGLSWVRDRFVDVNDKDGNPIEPGTTIIEEVEYEGEKIKTSRVFIRSGLRDNPFLMHDREYVGALLQLPDDLRRAYLEGDWHSLQGTFFASYRPDGPRPGEPDNADHVIVRFDDSLVGVKRKRAVRAWNSGHRPGPDGYPRLDPWWPRAIGLDWGFHHRTAVLWGAKDQRNGQLHIYREESASGITTTLWGRRIAELSLKDMEGQPTKSLVCYTSHDMFAKRGGTSELTFVQMLAAGVEEVLGRGATFIPELLLRQMKENNAETNLPGFWERYQQFEGELKEHQHHGITFVPAGGPHMHVPALQLLREMLIFRRPFQDYEEQFDESVWARIYRDKGEQEAAEYMAMFQRDANEYPRLQIWDCCKRLVAAIPKMMHQDPDKPGANPEALMKEHVDGRDEVDALLHIVFGMQNADASPPFAVRQAEFVERSKDLHPEWGAREMIFAQQAFENSERVQSAGLYFGRMARGKQRERGAERMRKDQWLRRVN